MIEYIIYPALFLFIWVGSFLWHEMFHIIGTGKLHGIIRVDGLSMSASPANLWIGGIGAGMIYTVAGILIWCLESHAIGYLFMICGVCNLVYGVFETMFLPKWGNNRRYKLGRYGIYIATIFIMIGIWMVFLR